MTKNSKKYSNDSLLIGKSSMQGWRLTMEDADIVNLNLKSYNNDKISLFAIFDGHGGPEVSNICKLKFEEFLISNPNYKNGDYKKALSETYLNIDRFLRAEEGLQLFKAYSKDHTASNITSGSTALVILIVNDTIFAANAGDCRAYIYNKNEELNNYNIIPLSFDHKPMVEIERRRIMHAGGIIEDGRINRILNLSRAIGDLEFKKNENLSEIEQLVIALPDIITHKIDPNDKFIIMGCDGIWEKMNEIDICNLINNRITSNYHLDLSVILEEIFDKSIAEETIEGLGCDNMSGILIKLLNNY